MVRITPDLDYWTSLLGRAQNFFYKVAIPELVACHFTRGSKKAPVLPDAPLTEAQQSVEKRPTKNNTKQRWCTCGQKNKYKKLGGL